MRAGQGLARVVLSRFSLQRGARDRADFRAFHKRVRRRGAGAEGPNSRVARKRQGRAIAASRAGTWRRPEEQGQRVAQRAQEAGPCNRGLARGGYATGMDPNTCDVPSRPRARGALRRVSFLPRRADVPRLAGAWQAENAALNFFRPAGRAFAQQNGPLRVFQPGRDGALKPYPTGVRLSGKRLGNCFTTGGGVW